MIIHQWRGIGRKKLNLFSIIFNKCKSTQINPSSLPSADTAWKELWCDHRYLWLEGREWADSWGLFCAYMCPNCPYIDHDDWPLPAAVGPACLGMFLSLGPFGGGSGSDIIRERRVFICVLVCCGCEPKKQMKGCDQGHFLGEGVWPEASSGHF